MFYSYKSLHLSAMGGAIPHLTLLATSLPDILPFGTEELKVEYFTGTVGVTDEVTPEDEEQDSYLRERSKSTLSVIFHIGKGDEPQHLTKANSAGRGKPGKRGPRKRGHAKANKETRERMEGVEGTEPKEGSDVRHVRIVEEPEQDEEDDNAMDSS
jgi:ribonuclease P/MRP protein subunit RPP20